MNQHRQILEFKKIAESLIHEQTRYGRRCEKRRSRSISLQIKPLDDDFHDEGETFWVISRDISRRGLGFISAEQIRHEYLRIGLLDYDTTVIAQVRHSTAIGDQYPLYLVGVEFVVATD